MRRHSCRQVCAFVVRKPPKIGFLTSRPICFWYYVAVDNKTCVQFSNVFISQYTVLVKKKNPYFFTSARKRQVVDFLYRRDTSDTRKRQNS